jgi:hypothetical protein
MEDASIAINKMEATEVLLFVYLSMWRPLIWYLLCINVLQQLSSVPSVLL